MASGGKKNRDSDEEEGGTSGGALGAALVIAGGAMLGAALFYGAKKLCDIVSEQMAEVDKYSESDQPAKKIDDDEDDDDDMPLVGSSTGNPQPGTSTASKPFGAKEEEEFTSLVDGLESYEESYVRVSPDGMQEACQVLEEVKDIFMQTCAEQLKGHPIGALVTSGSAVDGLKVVCPDEFDVTVPLEVDDNIWELVEGGTSVMDATGYWLIKRKAKEFYPVGSGAYDRYTVDEYLSANKIRDAFQELMVGMVNSTTKFTIRPGMAGHTVSLSIAYGNNKHLIVNFIPTFCIHRKTLQAMAHPKSNSDVTYNNLWRESFFERECEKVEALSGAGCQLKCLRIMKAVRLNNPAFGVLPSYFYKNVLFQLVDEDEEDWCDRVLSERFLDFLKSIEDCLVEGRLSHYYNPNVNLLQGYRQSALINLRHFISRIIGRNEFHLLLKKVY